MPRPSVLSKTHSNKTVPQSPYAAAGGFLISAQPNHPSDHSSGFTLVELITTLLMISILAVTAMAKWPGPALSLDAQSKQLLADIRYTQTISSSREQRYRINFATDRYWISNIDNSIILDHPASGQSQIILETGNALASTDSFLVFDEMGAPYTDALLPGTPLAVAAVITLSSGSDSTTIRISPETGRAIIQ